MPAYAWDGKVIVYFQNTVKFWTCYLTLSFSESANLDKGAMWPVSFSIKKLTSFDEDKIAQHIKKALSQASNLVIKAIRTENPDIINNLNT